MYQLVVSEHGKTKFINLPDYFVVGSSSACQLKINDSAVSERHFRIEKKQNRFTIRDLMSRSGTFVNGTEIVEAVLNDNDQIYISKNIEMTFQKKAAENKKEGFLNSLNPVWSKQLETLPNAAASELSILLLAESGSGKEVLANEIHKLSSRHNGPLISINCSALSDSLIESELFGHVKGSYTGATNDRKGAFESARGGTLFLDEIGDLPLNLQPKLLRALENHEIRPVGSDRTVKTDVRVIAATHQNLQQKVKNKEFRADLYYRLNVIQLTPPPLRHRLEDFETLAYTFCRQYRVRLSFEAIQSLKDYSWPGNIRELKNTIAKIAALFPKQHIQANHLEAILDTTENVGQCTSTDNVVPFHAHSGGKRRSRIQKIEREMIIEKLIANNGNQRKTAAELGVPKSTLHDRIKSYKIDVRSLCANHSPESLGHQSVTKLEKIPRLPFSRHVTSSTSAESLAF